MLKFYKLFFVILFSLFAGTVSYSQDNPVATFTVLNSTLNASCSGSLVSFTATVITDAAPVTTGTVTFSEGITILASNLALNASGQAIFSTSSLTVGAHTIRATYNGTVSFTTSNGSITHTVDEAALINVGPDQTVCATEDILLNATLSGLATNMVWQLNAAYGQFITPDTDPNTKFRLNEAGQALTSISFSAMTNDPFGACQGGVDELVIFIIPAPTVKAGNDITICSSTSSFPALNGSIGGVATSATWTGGAGTFSPNANTLNATYIPSGSELVNGDAVILTLTTNDPEGICNAASDEILYTIDKAALINVGPDQTVCATDEILLNATLSGLATNMVWQLNAAYGNFTTPDTDPHAKFKLNAAGQALPSISFSAMTNDPIGVCQGGVDELVIYINPAATANAGNDINICSSVSSFPALNGSIGGSATSATWSGGTGTFSPDASTLNATYIPSASELTNGAIILLSLTTDDPQGICSAASDQLLYIIDQAAVINAGPDQTVCATDEIQFNATLSGLATNMVWQLNSQYGNFIGPDTYPDAKFLLNALGQTQTSISFSAMTNDPIGACQGGVDEVIIFITPAGNCNIACVPPTISSPGIIQPDCNTATGTITVNATGTGPLEYRLNSGNWLSSNSFTGLTPGNYNISVRLQSNPTCITDYSANPVVLNPATGCNTCVLTCPANIIVNNKIGYCGANVNYTVGKTGNCGIVTYSKASGAFFPIGTTTVLVRSASGSTCSFKVTVLDKQKPMIVCPADIVVTAASNSCSKVVNFTVQATDNCPGAVKVTTVPASGTSFPIGTTIVTATAKDLAGNLASTTFTVKVKEIQPPVIKTVASPIVLSGLCNGSYKTIKALEGIVSVKDNCCSISAANVKITKVTSDEPENAPGEDDGNTTKDIKIGTDCKSVDLRRERKKNGNGRVYTIYVSVTDPSGNTGTASFKVIAPIVQNGTTAVDSGPVYTVNGSCNGINYKSGTEIQEVVDTRFTVTDNFILEQNYPNPFSSVTVIKYSLSSDAHISLGVYDQLGQRVAQLAEGRRNAGNHQEKLDATKLGAGIYLYRLQAIGSDGKPVVITKTMIVAR